VHLLLFLQAQKSRRGSAEFEVILLIWGSVRCALATKIGGEAKAHEISNTYKWFGQNLTSLGDIKIINIFNEVPKSKLRENKILMSINIKLS